MKMVRSYLGTSGVIFTLDPESGFRDIVLITASYDLGENIVQGAINPDEYYVFKPTFKTGHRAIIRKTLGSKEIKMVYGGSDSMVLMRNVEVPKADRRRFCISDDDALKLTGYAILVEEHYSKKVGKSRPMDIEWATDGRDGEIFIVQARPETVQSQKAMDVLETYHLDGRGRILVRGRSIGEKITNGKARVIPDVDHLDSFKPGEILVAHTTTPDWEPIMKIAAGIVRSRGGRTCHAAIVSRELGIPAVVGTMRLWSESPLARRLPLAAQRATKAECMREFFHSMSIG
jgi:pyruvate,water dikinase